MFRLINKTINKAKSQSGQVAIVLLLIVALALIFYAASLNFGRVNQTKTLTMVAANTSASQMASSIASYGQQQWQTTIGGKTKGGDPKYCKSSSIIVSIILLLVLIIIIILCWGGCAIALPAVIGGSVSLLAVAVTAAVITAVTLVLQAAVIQPAMLRSWNKVQQAALSTKDQFLESGISGALQNTVTDSKQVPDLYDGDQDSLYVTNLSENNPYKDTISRYAVYYNERMKAIKRANLDVIKFFLKETKELAFSGDDNWGLYDDGGGACTSAICNPCCVKATIEGEKDDDGKEDVEVRPEGCLEDAEAICAATSPYGAEYPFVYDPFLENTRNNEDEDGFVSFREFLGKDDEIVKFRTDSTVIPFNPLESLQALDGTSFRMEDASGFYINPPYSSDDNFTLDQRRGLFASLYKALDWTYTLSDVDTNKETDCHWCDARGGTPECSSYPQHPLELDQLQLPIDPATLDSNYCVDESVDAVVSPTTIETTEDCAGNPFVGEEESDEAALKGFWKKGNDNLCSTEWPYDAGCLKHAGGCKIISEEDENGNPVDPVDTDCMCEDSSAPELWNDDALDEMVKGIPKAVYLISALQSISAGHLVQAFDRWYPEVAKFIEPLVDAGPEDVTKVDARDFTDVDGKKAKCFECQGYDKVIIEDRWKGRLQEPKKPWLYEGVFHTWLRNIRGVKNRIEKWLGYSFVADESGEVTTIPKDDFEGYVSDDAWCFPTDTSTMSEEEAATIDANENGVEKDVGDVIACLDWNVNDTISFTDPITGEVVGATGNAGKFALCATRCDEASCSDLPRSPVADFDLVSFLPQDPENEKDIAAMLKCFYNCNNTDCQAMPTEDKDATPFFDIDPSTVDFEASCISENQVGEVWAQKIMTAIATISEGGQCVPGGDETFLGKVKQAALVAQNQVAKFEHRKKFLKNRLDEFEGIAINFAQAEKKIADFLDCTICTEDDVGDDPADPLCIKGKPKGAACALIQDRIDFEEKEGLPYQAIYGWRSDITEEQRNNGKQERWHLVRVDARVPGRCDRACHDEGQRKRNKNKKFPWVEGSSHGFLGSKICYTLVDREGIVKVRVTRWDEDPGVGASFANGKRLWNPKFSHPAKEDAKTGSGGLLGSCEPFFLRQYPPPNNKEIPWAPFDGAFLMNERIERDLYDLTEIPEEERYLYRTNEACWDAAENLLSQGVMSETCAKYFWHFDNSAGKHAGMSLKFIKCKDFK